MIEVNIVKCKIEQKIKIKYVNDNSFFHMRLNIFLKKKEFFPKKKTYI